MSTKGQHTCTELVNDLSYAADATGELPIETRAVLEMLVGAMPG